MSVVSRCEVGVCRKSPWPIQLIGADLPTSPLQPTDKADVGDWSAKGVLMSVWCSHQIRKFETESRRIEPILLYNFQMFGYSVILSIIHFIYFFIKRRRIGFYIIKKKKKKKAPFYTRFLDFYPRYKFTLSSLITLTLSLALASR